MDNPGKMGTPGMPSRDSTLINKYMHKDLRPVSVKETPKPGGLTAHDPVATSSHSSSPLLGTWAEPTPTRHRQRWGGRGGGNQAACHLSSAGWPRLILMVHDFHLQLEERQSSVHGAFPA